MADLSGYNVPKERPVPQQEHIDAAIAEETYKSALRITLAKIQAAYTGNEPMKDGPEMYKEAKAYVEKEGAEKIMVAHNAKLPSARDLDAVADEQKAADATADAFEAEVKALMESEGLSWKKAAKRIQEQAK
jgi:hypothetical protein